MLIILKERILSIVLIIYVAVFIYSLFYRLLDGDEAILAEHAYWLLKEGKVKSVLLSGLGLDWEIQQFPHHKLFILNGALTILLFGFSLAVFKLNTLFYVLLFLYLLWLYCHGKRNLLTGNHFILVIIVLLSNSIFFDFAFIFRPEIMLMTIGFGSFLLLEKGLHTHKMMYCVVAGLLAGLGMLTHLNGIIYIAAGFVLLLLRKEIKHAFIFGIVAGLTALLYFYDIHSYEDWKVFIFQFTSDPNLEKSDFSLLTPFVKLLDEQMRFFWDYHIASFSVVMLLAFIFCWKTLKTQHANLLIYLFTLVIVLGGISHGKTIKYWLLYCPYIAIVIAIALHKLHELPWFAQRLLLLACIFSMTINSWYIYTTCSKKIDYANRNQEIAKAIGNDPVNVMAELSFTFNELTNYRVQSVFAFSILYGWQHKGEYSLDNFFSFAEKNQNQYIILDRVYDSQNVFKLINYQKIAEGDVFGNYTILKKKDGYLIFKLI